MILDQEIQAVLKDLRERPRIHVEYEDSIDELHDRAANVIEELKKQVDKNNNWRATAKKLIDMVTTIPRWVHVKECLPENPGEYLVYLRSPEKAREDWAKSGLVWDGSYVTTAYYNDRQKIWQIDKDAYNTDLSVVNLEDDYSISYWMPLPNAPEVEE